MRLIYLVIIPIVFFFLLKKKDVMKSIVLFFILLLFCAIMLNEKINFSFNIKKKIPVIMFIDYSRSFSNFLPIVEKAKRYFDEVYYFSDSFSKKKEGLNREFSYILKNIKDFKTKNKDESKIVVFSDLMDNSTENLIEMFNVYFVYLTNENTTNIFINDIKIPQNIFSEEPFNLELKVFSKDRISTFVEIKDDGIIYKTNILLESGFNSIKLNLKFNFNGFKKLTFLVGDSKIERLIYFSKESYKIFVASGYPDEEFVFLKNFLEDLKWVSVIGKVLITHNERLNIPKNYNGYVFINLDLTQINNINELKELKAIYLFHQKNKLFTFLTNSFLLETKKNENYEVYILSNNSKVIEGIKLWKKRLRTAVIDENSFDYYSEFWLENFNDFFENKEFTPLEKYNYVLNERSSFDTDKLGLFESKGIKYFVHLNEREDFYPALNVKNAYEFFSLDIKKFVNDLRNESKIIKTISINIDFSKNIFVFLVFIVLLFFFWFYRR